MPKKIRAVAMLIENIGLIAFGIANIFVGIYLWQFHPFLTVAVCAVSPVFIVRGGSDLLENFYTKGKRKK